MARPKKDVSAYLGLRIPDSRLTILSEAGRDSHGRILVKTLCDCGTRKRKILSQVLSGHTKSCGCLKHQRHVEYTQGAVDRLSATQIMQCFLAIVDKNAPRPNLPQDVIVSAFVRRTEALESLPWHVKLDVRLRVLAHDNYSAIAKDNGLHPAEIAWMYKHLIKPVVEAERKGGNTQDHLKEHALRDIANAKETLKKQKRYRFWVNELQTPGSKSGRKAHLGFAWYWMMDCAPFTKLNSDEESLLNWFRLTAARTFRARRDKRREMAGPRHEENWNEIETAADWEAILRSSRQAAD
jgi:hypothetical protein